MPCGSIIPARVESILAKSEPHCNNALVLVAYSSSQLHMAFSYAYDHQLLECWSHLCLVISPWKECNRGQDLNVEFQFSANWLE